MATYRYKGGQIVSEYFEKLQQCLISNARPAENMRGDGGVYAGSVFVLGIKAPQRRALMKEVGLPNGRRRMCYQLAAP